MTLSDLASIGSLVSGIAVLVSLIYLNQQTRQGAKHTRALVQQGRVEIARGLLEPLVSSPSLAETYARVSVGDYAVDDAHIIQYFIWLLSIFYHWEDQFFQYRAGLVDENRQTGLILSMKSQFQSPESRAVWKLARGQFSPETQTFIEGVMRQASSDAATSFSATMASSWRAVAAAERSGTSA
jgi:hypothetical protein